MCRLKLAFTLGIFLAVAGGCSGGSGSSADASAPPATGQGGVLAAGGATASGGVAATGGAIPTGGTGGRTVTGGVTAAGGTRTGGSATGGRTSTATGGTGTGTGTGTSGTGACGVPACYTDLFSKCIPDGTCVQQLGYMCGATVCPDPLTSMPTSMFNYSCYSNGVKILFDSDMTNPASMTAITTVTKNSVVCYTSELLASQASADSVTTVVKNPAGDTVLTYSINTVARTETITCAGGSPVVISLDCFTSSSTDGGTRCTTGTCTP